MLPFCVESDLQGPKTRRSCRIRTRVNSFSIDNFLLVLPEVLLMVCGPLERLSLGGVLCGCLESQDQFYYRLAYLTLQSQQVRWFRRLGQYNLQNANATSSKADNDGADNNTSQSSTVVGSVAKPPNAIMSAQLDVVDTTPGPAIRLTSAQFVFADEEDGDVQVITDNIVLSKTVLLRDVVSVTGGTVDEWARMGLLAGEGRIRNTGVLVKFRGSSDVAKERALIFEVKAAPNNAKHGLSRDDVVKHLNTLLDFERSRLGLPALEAEKQENGKSVSDDRDGTTDRIPASEIREEMTEEERYAIIPFNRTMSLNEEF